MTFPADPEQLGTTANPRPAEIPAATRMGAVHLTVASLQRSLDYYTSAIGLEVTSSSGGQAVLGSGGSELLFLTEQAGAAPADGYSGLYHFALLLPERRDLAMWLAHAARDRVELTGMSDHYVSEALYLSDPDHHGIEIYWDRPRAIWEGQVAQRLTSVALDVEGLLGELGEGAGAGFAGLPAGTTMGHVHLRVADERATVKFYRDVLGFALMAEMGNTAAFLSAGGYHHHLGANTWESRGAPRPPAGSATLTQMTVVLPAGADLDALAGRVRDAGHPATPAGDGYLVLDPSGNPVALTAG